MYGTASRFLPALCCMIHVSTLVATFRSAKKPSRSSQSQAQRLQLVRLLDPGHGPPLDFVWDPLGLAASTFKYPCMLAIASVQITRTSRSQSTGAATSHTAFTPPSSSGFSIFLPFSDSSQKFESHRPGATN
ncbi:hypothetical protein ABW21_db0209561 [Orbilia brochopaga]|nr:hypothetical protein ABW21_db0209561 [Drechslerella brochopaga]